MRAEGQSWDPRPGLGMRLGRPHPGRLARGAPPPCWGGGEVRKKEAGLRLAPAPGFVPPAGPAHGSCPVMLRVGRAYGLTKAGAELRETQVGAGPGLRSDRVAARKKWRLTGPRRSAGASRAPWRKAGAPAALQCHQRNGFHMSGPKEKGGNGRLSRAGQEGVGYYGGGRAWATEVMGRTGEGPKDCFLSFSPPSPTSPSGLLKLLRLIGSFPFILFFPGR